MNKRLTKSRVMSAINPVGSAARDRILKSESCPVFLADSPLRKVRKENTGSCQKATDGCPSKASEETWIYDGCKTPLVNY